jgi:phosphate transport system substrate-binding protein
MGTLCVGAATAAEEIKIAGTGAALGTMRQLAGTFSKQNPDVKVTVLPSIGSGGGIKAAAKGAIAIAVSSRPLKEDERGLGLVESEYARTPFVFVVSTRSRLTAITTANVADLYAGRTQTWSDGSRIRVVLRPVGDGDSDQMKIMTPGMAEALTQAEQVPGIAFAMTDQDAANDLERIPGAFGSIAFAVIKSENRSLRPLELDGVAATVQNAAGGSYPHYKRLYLVTQAKPPAAAQRFVAFLHSPRGVEILARNGNWTP